MVSCRKSSSCGDSLSSSHLRRCKNKHKQHQQGKGNATRELFVGTAGRRKLTVELRQNMLRGWLRDLDLPPSVGWIDGLEERAAIAAFVVNNDSENVGQNCSRIQPQQKDAPYAEFVPAKSVSRPQSPVVSFDRERPIECPQQQQLQRPNPSAPPPSSSSISVPASASQVSANTAVRKRLRWVDNRTAKQSVMVALSFFYAMLATIFALVFELSHIITGDTRNRRSLGLKELVFGLYMYGNSIAFLLYCYIALLLNPRWKRRIGTLVQFQNRTESSQNIVQDERKVSHNSPSAGSLFLRLGCVVFGVIGTVYYAFDVFLCISDDNCHQHYLICLDLLAIVFVFTQMHFVFCNWKLTISQHQMTCRFGTMHLVATNLWIWIRYILIEESLMGDEIRLVFARHVASTPSPLNSTRPFRGSTQDWSGDSTEQLLNTRGSTAPPTMNPGMAVVMSDTVLATAMLNKRSLMRRCQGAECVLASFNEVMYTSIVEYSLIGAAVMFIVWRNIGKVERQVTRVYVPRKHRIRLDCSKSTTGLFFGLAFLAGTFTSMAVFSGYTIMGQNHLAATLFGFTDIVQYLISTCACGVALWRMRLLRFHSNQSEPHNHHHHHQQQSNEICMGSRRESASTKTAITFASSAGTLSSSAGTSSSSTNGQSNSQELLDMILLAFGMTGEMIYSVAGLLGLTGDPNWQPLTIILLAVHITRILEVGLQSCLIYIAGKLRVGNDPLLRETQPGKQAITFLLLANISMFLMNLLEAEKAGVSETVVNFYGKRSWVFLVRSFSPLTIFYRFHSSVCLAEVWKSTYSWKE